MFAATEIPKSQETKRKRSIDSDIEDQEDSFVFKSPHTLLINPIRISSPVKESPTEDVVILNKPGVTDGVFSTRSNSSESIALSEESLEKNDKNVELN